MDVQQLVFIDVSEFGLCGKLLCPVVTLDIKALQMIVFYYGLLH